MQIFHSLLCQLWNCVHSLFFSLKLCSCFALMLSCFVSLCPGTFFPHFIFNFWVVTQTGTLTAVVVNIFLSILLLIFRHFTGHRKDTIQCRFRLTNNKVIHVHLYITDPIVKSFKNPKSSVEKNVKKGNEYLNKK